MILQAVHQLQGRSKTAPPIRNLPAFSQGRDFFALAKRASGVCQPTCVWMRWERDFLKKNHLTIISIINIVIFMTGKHEKTLIALFASPVPRNIPFRNVVSLLTALGCRVKQREGSRIDFIHGRRSLHLHEPHPGKEIKPYQVKAVREFLQTIGVES